MSDSWPPQLKDWVAKCLGQMTDSNRAEGQKELRQVIADAFEAKTLWTTDWNGVQLQSLVPKPLPTLNNLKRKSTDLTPASKKAKKASNKKVSSFGSDTTHINDQAALNRRAERFQREHEIERLKSMHIDSSTSSNRSNWNSAYRSSPHNGNGHELDPEEDSDRKWGHVTIVGTCQDIFKEYLRLTSEPKSEKIRPPHILQQTLMALKKKWREKAPYNWVCSQFKSMRQDLTVQHIKNEFTVQVYEIHGRMALESNDMVEYNQCQALLKTLYDMGIPGKVDEFTAYRVLMLIHGRNKSELNFFIGQLTSQQKSEPAIRHAINVHRALSFGNYHTLFELFTNCPNMGGYIMDHFIDRERVKALIVMTKAYMTLSLSFIQSELAFDGPDATRGFLSEHSAAYFSDSSKPDSEKILECRPAAPQLAKEYETKYFKVSIKGRI